MNPVPKSPNLPILCLAFAGAAAASRLIIRHHESRWQMAAFVAAAGVYELGMFALGRPGSLLRPIALSGVSALSILLVKLVLEPYAVPLAIQAVDQHGVRHTAKQMMKP